MNYQPVTAENQTNKNVGPQEANGDTADDAAGETPVQKPTSENEQALKNVLNKMMDQEKEDIEQSDAVRKEFEAYAFDDDDDLDTCNSPYADQGMGAEANFNNMKPSTVVSPITTTRVHSIHPKDQIIGDPSNAQKELLQFKIQKVWTLVNLPYGKKAIGTKWVYRNKKDKRGIVVRNKARLVAQGYKQEEGIDYDEVPS
ncbi:putative ribonuclease H-like domain-containing protein [Tanacetum coccineum]